MRIFRIERLEVTGPVRLPWWRERALIAVVEFAPVARLLGFGPGYARWATGAVHWLIGGPDVA